MKVHITIVGVIVFMLVLRMGCLASPLSDSVEVSGVILTSKGVGIPGAIVSVVSSETRQKPAFSDNMGRFSFHVSVNESATWYVEIYWNRDLIYRNELRQLKTKGDGSNFGAVWDEAFKLGGHVDLEPIVLGKGTAQGQ